jgi:hypothetical protein
MIQRLKPATVVNVSGDRRKFSIDHAPGVMPDVHDLAPGESVEIPGAYAVRRQTGPGRELLPSIVEMLTGGGVIPATDPKARKYLEGKASPQGKRAG